ncbi:HAMP domain-containing sensor histidine kinase [Cytophagaceae bacterium DM2B3-1]|uniref:histidine kinase n=1 Tax=Xanthocytophaga flava TaxID=3048013 RepID=A0ABT7CGY3_9BACT|nr:HAMP domain-containing sensor histidine kinase [Xanthocytophaga flavus]MDJ1493005.1 HAMP domain-containing sensor histidine kinase [Xanthocytophaga flavus]
MRFTVLVVGIQLFFSIFIYYFNSVYRQQEFYSRLQGKARLAARLLIKRNLLSINEKHLLAKGDLSTLSDERISIFSSDEKLIFTNGDSLHAQSHAFFIDKLKPDLPFTYTSDRFELAGIVYPYNEKHYFVFASGYDQSGFSKLENMAMILLLGNLVVLVFIVFAGWYFASESLAPISDVVQQVDSITASRLDLRVNEGNGEDEIAKLAITFNRMLDRVQQAFESQRSFVSHASHELRTPLTNALGTLETSLIYDKELTVAKVSMASAIEELNNIIELTNGLLSLTKADATFSSLTPIRLDECILDALSLIYSKYKTREIVISLPESIPADSEPFLVEANMQLLRTAFVNILDNACKYSTQAVGLTLEKKDNSTFLVTVTDKGIGIEEEQVDKVFLPLYRATNSRNFPGFGIGLAVTKKIIDLFKGTISIDSTSGEGTIVMVEIPAAPFSDHSL